MGTESQQSGATNPHNHPEDVGAERFVDQCQQLREWTEKLVLLSAVLALYFGGKLVTQTSGMDVRFLAQPWSQDLLGIVLAGVFGYGVISVGVEYLRLTYVHEDLRVDVPQEDIRHHIPIAFYQNDEHDYWIGFAITGCGLLIILASVVLLAAALMANA